MSKPCHFFFQNKNEAQIFTINKPNIMKKSKYQQYFHCFIVCILIPYAFWLGYQQNISILVICAAFRSVALITGEALIRGRRLFQCGYPKVRYLLKDGVYLRVWLLAEFSNYSDKRHIKKCGAYQREVLISMWILKSMVLIRGRHSLEEI